MERTLDGEFEFVTELCAVLAEKSDLQSILDFLVHKCTTLLGTDDASIKLRTPDADTAQTLISDSRTPGLEAGATSWPRLLKESVMGYLLFTPGELAAADIASDPRFPGLRERALPARALLAVPLKVDGQITGMLAASNAAPGRTWTRHDVQLMTILASHSAGVIEKARLRLEAEGKQRLELEKSALDKELLLAREIQMRLIPGAPLIVGNWQLEGRVLPAQQVGGDLYDHFQLPDGRVAFVIADVAGKGIPAALLVSTVHSAMRAFAENGLDPARLVVQLNRTVLRSSAAGRFITMFYGDLDPGSGRLRYVNAGHVHPRLRRADGQLEPLSTGALPLGLFEDAVFDASERMLAPGDALLLVSDGIPEAMDSFQAEFGEVRVDTMWTGSRVQGPTAFLDQLMREVRNFRGAAPQADDETALVVQHRLSSNS